ncbi:MAG: hypothetical protein IJ848_01905 [Alphaproteobacteria bacterium]|nr:hypothetical protein [Alphaproteobacteria bacterium]
MLNSLTKIFSITIILLSTETVYTAVIINDGTEDNYADSYIKNCIINHSCNNDIKIGKYNNFHITDSEIEINNSNIDCPGCININMHTSVLKINLDQNNVINLLQDGINNINLIDSSIIINNNMSNNIDLFSSIDSLPKIESKNSKIILTNVNLNLHNGYLNIHDNSELKLNNSTLAFSKGAMNINNSNCEFNSNSLIKLNNGIVKITGSNSTFSLKDSKMTSQEPNCTFEVYPNNDITLDNSTIKCSGKFKKIQDTYQQSNNNTIQQLLPNNTYKISSECSTQFNSTGTLSNSKTNKLLLKCSAKTNKLKKVSNVNMNKKQNKLSSSLTKNKKSTKANVCYPICSKRNCKTNHKKSSTSQNISNNNSGNINTNFNTNNNITNNRMLHIKNNSLFQWDVIRCDQYDLTDIDNNSMVVVKDYYD